MIIMQIINENYKKWIFLTNTDNKFFVTLIGGFSKYFLFDYCTSLIKSLISRIYNLLIDFRLSLDDGLLECGILQHIEDTYLNNASFINYIRSYLLFSSHFYNKKIF